MNEQILKIIHKKFCEGFKTNFLPRKQFEKEFPEISDRLLKIIVELTKRHQELKHSKIEEDFRQIVKFSKDEFILEQFNSNNNRNYGYGRPLNKYTIDNLLELQNTRQDDFERFSGLYEKYFNSDDKRVVELPLLEFIELVISDQLYNENIDPNNENKSLDDSFWAYFLDNYFDKDYAENYLSYNINEIIDEPQNIIKKFTDSYLSNKFIKLLDKSEKHLADETISNFDTIIVNVGIRDFENGRAGWSTNLYKVINNGIVHSYSHSSKDEKNIKGEFINIFIHQKKHLLKISITLDEVERIPYIIYRDCEKISLKNESEIVIIKHHGNETLVFDERKEALAFQTKLIEIREGMGRKQ